MLLTTTKCLNLTVVPTSIAYYVNSLFPTIHDYLQNQDSSNITALSIHISLGIMLMGGYLLTTNGIINAAENKAIIETLINREEEQEKSR